MMRMGIFLAAAVVALGAAAPVQAHKRTRSNSFQGSCSFHVNVRFVPPLGPTPQQGTDFARGSGPCTGTWTGRSGKKRRLDDATVRYFAQDSGPSSCAEGAAAGGGYLAWRGRKLGFGLTEVRGGAVATLSFKGRKSGSAAGDARVSPDSDPAQVVQSCLGSGLSVAAVDIDFATTPSLTG